MMFIPDPGSEKFFIPDPTQKRGENLSLLLFIPESSRIRILVQGNRFGGVKKVAAELISLGTMRTSAKKKTNYEA
jgi:hypothetical protein